MINIIQHYKQVKNNNHMIYVNKLLKIKCVH